MNQEELAAQILIALTANPRQKGSDLAKLPSVDRKEVNHSLYYALYLD